MSFTWLSGAVKYDEDERTQTWVVADEFKPKKIDEGKKISCEISSEDIDSCIIDEETQKFMDAISDEIIQQELEKISEEDDQEFMDAISDEIIQLELEKISEEDDDDLL